jgi:hypothetical protein
MCVFDTDPSVRNKIVIILWIELFIRELVRFSMMYKY